MLEKVLFVTKLFLDSWEKLVMHDTWLMVVLTFSSPERGLIREIDFTPVFSSPFVPFAEYQSIPDVFLKISYFFTALLTPGLSPKVFVLL